jgi:Synergist-CTERM protein sorting domain-containing protein
MKKFFTVLAAGLTLLIFAGAALASQELFVYYEVNADFTDGKSTYGSAACDGVRFYLEERPPVANPAYVPGQNYGTLSISNGSYQYVNENNVSETVDVSATKSFILRCTEVGSNTYAGFEPMAYGRNDFIKLTGGARTGALEGSHISWQFDTASPSTEHIILGLKIIGEQMTSYVPYVEQAGNTFSWRMVLPGSTNTPVSVAESGYYLISLRNKSGNDMITPIKSSEYTSPGTRTGSFIASAGFDAAKLGSVRVDFVKSNVPSLQATPVLSWTFHVSGDTTGDYSEYPESNEGLTSQSIGNISNSQFVIAALTTVNLPPINFKTGYSSYYLASSTYPDNPVHIDDPTIVAVAGWTYSTSGWTLSLRGLKAGSAKVVILYYGNGATYQTTPIHVTVTGNSGGGGSGGDGGYDNTGEGGDEWNDASGGSNAVKVGSGCNAGFGGGMLLLAAALIRRWKRGR